MRSNKLRLNVVKIILFVLFLSLPLLFISLPFRKMEYGLFFSLVSLVIVFLLVVLIYEFARRQKVRLNCDTFVTFILLSITLFNFNQTYSAYSLYLVLLFVIILIFSLSTSYIVLDGFRRGIIWLIILYFMATLILSLSSDYYQIFDGSNRFSGLMHSPTTFGIISLLFFTLYLKLSYGSSRVSVSLVYVVMLYLIFIAGSRLNLMVAILIPFYFLFINDHYFKQFRVVLFVVVMLSVFFIYPSYQYVKGNYQVEKLMRDNIAGSDTTRMIFSAKVINEISVSNNSEIAFGHGSNLSLDVIGTEKVKPHNDFLRIIYDYGVLFFILFLFKLYGIFKKDIYHSFVITIYMVSFYHNMVFDLYTVSFILIFTTLALNRKCNKQVCND